MKEFNIEITNEALRDLERIYLYIATKLLAPENASGQYERITHSTMKLDTMPERYRLIESEPEKSRGLRIMPVDSYSVIYIVKNQKVIITNILYSASDLHGRLK
ncbi:MAG: type II toxin-antitoxin system RelE/ParE family toxin [Anaerocolumna sp.]